MSAQRWDDLAFSKMRRRSLLRSASVRKEQPSSFALRLVMASDRLGQHISSPAYLFETRISERPPLVRGPFRWPRRRKPADSFDLEAPRTSPQPHLRRILSKMIFQDRNASRVCATKMPRLRAVRNAVSASNMPGAFIAMAQVRC
jgi:hypothetical protein